MIQASVAPVLYIFAAQALARQSSFTANIAGMLAGEVLQLLAQR
jgi:hypothetical protein